MDTDFMIRPDGELWRITAVSDGGKAFAETDSRFVGGEARLGAGETLTLYHELAQKLLFANHPDGLPAPDRGAVALRIILLFLLIFLPLALFALLM